MTINAYAALAAKEKLVPYSYNNAELKDNEVNIKISYCGICHSDIHLIDNDWNMDGYPLVPGHEVVGTINDKGRKVRNLEVGQRVGVGWQCGACYECPSCITGNEQLCPQSVATAVHHYGGFANYTRCDARFAIPILTSLQSEHVAPLLCGGITVYNPLRNYNIRPDMKVAVVGIGGLGHLAVQFYRAYGCEVTAISHSENKREEALEFGAHHFFATKNNDYNSLENYFDFILTTATVDLNWLGLVNALKVNGKLCLVGAAKNITVPVLPLLMGQKSIVTSLIGSPARIHEMLEFAARQRIIAKTELFKLSAVNEAIQKVRDNTVRYRAVLDCN
ncbi:MAG: NAD(P)-dependent alcohol dehydrogenase [Gammaproteobacteria bacterium]|nr:NAD(P)-dependent alcohol dehydrogenase [Gammaproteobacteria bacterium]